MNLIPSTDPRLWQPCESVTDVQSQVIPYLDDMKLLMRREGGVGLAANQVGITRAFFIFTFKGTVFCAINPRVIEQLGFNVSRIEGCLSFPGRTVYVPRRDIIKAEWTDETGRELAMTFLKDDARTFAHESDHLAGRTIHEELRPASCPLPVTTPTSAARPV